MHLAAGTRRGASASGITRNPRCARVAVARVAIRKAPGSGTFQGWFPARARSLTTVHSPPDATGDLRGQVRSRSGILRSTGADGAALGPPHRRRSGGRPRGTTPDRCRDRTLPLGPPESLTGAGGRDWRGGHQAATSTLDALETTGDGCQGRIHRIQGQPAGRKELGCRLPGHQGGGPPGHAADALRPTGARHNQPEAHSDDPRSIHGHGRTPDSPDCKRFFTSGLPAFRQVATRSSHPGIHRWTTRSFTECRWNLRSPGNPGPWCPEVNLRSQESILVAVRPQSIARRAASNTSFTGTPAMAATPRQDSYSGAAWTTWPSSNPRLTCTEPNGVFTTM